MKDTSKAQTAPSSTPARRGRGFAAAGKLLSGDIRRVTEGRGIALSRLVTAWDEVVGLELGRLGRPMEIRSSRGSLGATLRILATSSAAPLIEAQKTQIIDRVNQAFGYRAITRISISQTAPEGFKDGARQFERGAPRPKLNVQPAPLEPALRPEDPGLAEALALLGQNIRTSQG